MRKSIIISQQSYKKKWRCYQGYCVFNFGCDEMRFRPPHYIIIFHHGFVYKEASDAANGSRNDSESQQSQDSPFLSLIHLDTPQNWQWQKCANEVQNSVEYSDREKVMADVDTFRVQVTVPKSIGGAT
jgi:hypothetical protein